jgi:NAD(P) transhydrogenase subunit alpha
MSGNHRCNYRHGNADADDITALILGFLAVILGTLNVVGGFVVTDRMLEMFNKKK